MKILSIDAETNGLWGEAFAIGAVLYENGEETRTFLARCPINGRVDKWVSENVLPQLEDVKITHVSYGHMLHEFSRFYLQNKTEAEIIVHMGLPVETRLFLDAHACGYIGDWDAPYPLIDISAFPEIGTSVDRYNQRNGICVPLENGGTHNPLYDARAAALAYMHLNRKINKEEKR